MNRPFSLITVAVLIAGTSGCDSGASSKKQAGYQEPPKNLPQTDPKQAQEERNDKKKAGKRQEADEG
jgi:hypothetical protein